MVCAICDVAGAASLAFFVADGERHFEQEERLLVPAIPERESVLARRVLAEHEEIRRRATALGEAPDVAPAHELGELLTAHVRFEERRLFPLLESVLSAERLSELGAQLG